MSDISLKDYAATITKSGLLSSSIIKEQYASYCDSQEAIDDSEDADASSFAAYLESAALLTKWQNAKLLKGKYRGLMFGKFKMLRLLGIGGMGRVFLAEDQMLRRRVALKILPHKSSENASVLQRFHREAQALARLDHPNIVRVYDVDTRDNTHYIVMEYVQGIDLHKKVMADGPMGEAAVIECVRQVAVGLSHAHGNDLIHRDVKPANLLLDGHGTVKILDLGLALLQSEEDGSITVDPTKAMGTADYIAPEQALNSHNIDQRTDIYSLGCSLYFLLTGRPPFAQGTNAQRLMAHQLSTPEPANDVRKQKGLAAVSDALANICARMMEKNPDDRFANCSALADCLSRIESQSNVDSGNDLIPVSPLALPQHSSSTTDTLAGHSSETRSEVALIRVASDDRNRSSSKSRRKRPKRKGSNWGLYVAGGLLAAALIGLVTHQIVFAPERPRSAAEKTADTILQSVGGTDFVPRSNIATHYVATRSGKAYHVPDCKYLTKSTVMPVTQAERDARGLKPCSHCLSGR